MRAGVRWTGVAYAALSLIPLSFSAAAACSALNPRSPPERTRALSFFAWTGWVSLPLSVVLLAASPLVLLTDPVDRGLLNAVQQAWASATLYPFLQLNVRGELPKADKPAIYVSNHNSLLDPYVLMSLGLPMRFVAREEVFYIPLVGWVCFLIGHVRLVRGDAQSGKAVIEQCARKLAAGRAWSVVFFPEGSRLGKLSDGLGEFKIGAFKVAEQAGVPVTPVCIHGTRDAMPPGQELSCFKLGQTVTVDFLPMLQPRGDAQALKTAARESIALGLCSVK